MYKSAKILVLSGCIAIPGLLVLNRQVRVAHKGPRHRQPSLNALICIFWYGSLIMGKQHASFTSRPSQDRVIVHSRQSDILHTDYIYLGLAAHEASENTAIEVLIRQKPEHRAVPSTGAGRADGRECHRDRNASPSGGAGAARCGAARRDTPLPPRAAAGKM